MLDLKNGNNEKLVEENMCPIGLASHLLGDKWIAIIIRDIALFNRRTFNDILNNNRENISSGSLSARLKLMRDLNLLDIGTYEQHAQKKPIILRKLGSHLSRYCLSWPHGPQNFARPLQILSN